VQVPHEVTTTTEVQVPYQETVTHDIQVPHEVTTTTEVQVPVTKETTNTQTGTGNSGQNGTLITPPPSCEGSECNPGGGENPPPVDPPSPSPTPTASKPNINTSGLYGLFQQNSGEETIEMGTIVVIALDKPEMFFDPTYKRAGEEILNMAYKQYQQELAMGINKEEAIQTMTDMLLASGVNQTVAMAYSGIGFVPMAEQANVKPLALDGTEKNTKLVESLSTIANMITPQGVDDKQLRESAGERLKVRKIRITLPSSNFGSYFRRY
jgi:hypothetical protein